MILKTFCVRSRKCVDEEDEVENNEDNNSKIGVVNYLRHNPSIFNQVAEHISVVDSYTNHLAPVTIHKTDKQMEPNSLMFALEHGFSFVVFSTSHLYHPLDLIIHNGMGLRIILEMGMCLIWNESLVDIGAKSRYKDGQHMLDMRLF